MRSFTCIVCPIGCQLKAEVDPNGSVHVSGNRCPRGAAYAQEELTSPKRVVTATCRLVYPDTETQDRVKHRGLWDPARLPVKTTIPCPKEYIPELLQDLYQITVQLPVQRGQVIVKNWRNLGIDVIATRTLD